MISLQVRMNARLRFAARKIALISLLRSSCSSGLPLLRREVLLGRRCSRVIDRLLSRTRIARKRRVLNVVRRKRNLPMRSLWGKKPCRREMNSGCSTRSSISTCLVSITLHRKCVSARSHRHSSRTTHRRKLQSRIRICWNESTNRWILISIEKCRKSKNRMHSCTYLRREMVTLLLLIEKRTATTRSS